MKDLDLSREAYNDMSVWIIVTSRSRSYQEQRIKKQRELDFQLNFKISLQDP